MKRRVEYIFAGYGGKPVYVQGRLTDEAGPSVQLEVISTNPEPRPAPGLYRAGDLPGGWVRLLPDDSGTSGDDQAVKAAGRQAGFQFEPIP
jgi:hypothetical protein